MSYSNQNETRSRRGRISSWVPITKKQEDLNRRIREEAGGSSRVTNIRQSVRPYSKVDIQPSFHYPYLGGPRIHVEPLPQQERQLVEDLLNSFLGFSGYYIEMSDADEANGERQFDISPQVNVKLRIMTERILPLSAYYSRVFRFIQDNHALRAGRVNQALSEFLDREMQPFCQMVSHMEDKLLKGDITLTWMWGALHPYMLKLKTLYQIVRCVAGTTGGLTLTGLHEYITMTMADPEALQLFCQATEAASVPFFEAVSQWVHSGVILDPFDEFMIIEKTKKRNSNTNWDGVFIVDQTNVPSFLHKVVDHVFSAGKYLDAIRHSLSFMEDMPSVEHEPMKYNFYDPSYLNTIRIAHDFANVQLLNLLVVDREIIGRLRTAKAFYSLQYGDLFTNIIENCMTELKMPASEVCLSYLPSLLISAINSSCMKSLKYSKEVTVHLEKCSLLKQILSSADPLNSYKNIIEEKQLMGIDAMTLKTTNKWPDCLIMHDKAVRCYQMLFRHLFNTKLIQLRVAETHLKPLTSKQCLLKHCMLTFITSILSYMTQGTVEHNWVEFEALSPKANNVEELRAYHDDFLYRSLTNCMLTSADLYKKFRRAMDVCSVFAQDPEASKTQDFFEIVTDLINAANEANLPGIEGFTALIQPTFEYTSSQTWSQEDSSSGVETNTSQERFVIANDESVVCLQYN